MARYNASLAREAVAEYVKVAAEHGLKPSQLAIAWCRSQWFVASTIVGATTMEQLRENVEAFDLELSADCLADVERVYRRYKDPAFN
jgi:aryl-alcohol dehydrogenase-like predicted oxidoreductase